MPKTVLIIDDQERFLNTLKLAVETLGYEVEVSIDAHGALHLISLKHFDAIICDVQMPNASGFDFLKQASKITTSPVILMTGFSEIADAERATREGAKGFLAKPFNVTEVKKILDEVSGKIVPTKESALEPAADQDEDFFPLMIDEFVFGKKIQFDIFVRVKASKYLKIAHGGEDLDPARVSKFKEKGLKMLYLRREDYKQYVSFLLNINTRIVQNKSLDFEKRVKVLKLASEASLKGMFLGSLTEPELGEAKGIVSCVHEIISEDESLNELLTALRSGGDALYTHAIAVSVLSVMVARALNWTSQITIMSVGLAGFFHDIGKKELPPELLAKSRIQYSSEEVNLYETHPARGANLLSLNPKLRMNLQTVSFRLAPLS